MTKRRVCTGSRKCCENQMYSEEKKEKRGAKRCPIPDRGVESSDNTLNKGTFERNREEGPYRGSVHRVTTRLFSRTRNYYHEYVVTVLDSEVGIVYDSRGSFNSDTES